jgi:proline utilization trans-activator
VTCNFEAFDKKVFVSESRLNALQRRLERYERQQSGSSLSFVRSPLAIDRRDEDSVDIGTSIDTAAHPQVSEVENDTDPDVARESTLPASDLGVKDSEWTSTSNPLVSKGPSYVTDVYGRLRYLGHSSTWSFSRQVLGMAYERAHSSHLPETFMNIEADVYGLNWQSSRVPPVHSVSGIPSLERSLFLLQTVKFHTNCLYHLFDEESFTSNLYQFYDNPEECLATSRAWFSHYLILMAFGKAFSPGSQATEVPSGIDLFARGIKALPDVIHLCHEPILGSEILCSIALYLQCIDHRPAAHIYIGQAARMALSHGLHADIQASDMGDHLMQRCRKIWWTIYNLDRKLSSLMGSPNLLNDQDITTPLPVFPRSSNSTEAFAIHVQMSRLLGQVIGTVYSIDGTFNKAFLKTTKSVLRGIAGIADDLAVFSSRCFGEISRLAADLNLAYHRIIILATRPIIFYLLKFRLESQQSSGLFPLPESVKGMVQACLDSAGQVLAILNNLKFHEVIETFLPFDLESVFSAGLVLHMVAHVHPKFLDTLDWQSNVFSILDVMVANGNLLARLRKTEIEELSSMFNIIKARPNTATPRVMQQESPAGTATDLLSLPSLGPPFFDGEYMDEGLSGAQILDLADALNEADFYGIWSHDLE